MHVKLIIKWNLCICRKPKNVQEDDDDDDGFFGPALPPGFKKQDDSPGR